MARPIYLDYHATTPVDPRVLEAMLPWFTERFGNPAARHHQYGWEADEAVERARRQVARLIGAQAKDILFTSGATESNNLALRGVMLANRERGEHLVTVATEHKAVLETCQRLEEDGWHVTVLPVGADGLVDLDQLADALTDRTVLVSVMAANNEIGVLQPLAEIARLCRARGVLLHTDAVQALGRVPFDVDALPVDLASITGHKIYGPKGVGALYVRRQKPRVPLAAILDGGGQERGLRPGTLNVPAIVGLGAAAALADEERATEAARLARLRDRLRARLESSVDGLRINGSWSRRLPNNLHVSFDGVDGDALITSLSDVAVSAGSACASGKGAPSHVLTALGVDPARAAGSIRFGLGRWTTEDEVETAARRVAEEVTRLRTLTPA
ncbi:MAG: cysteine desulfurase family protein [Vicinamibacteria bacterium]